MAWNQFIMLFIMLKYVIYENLTAKKSIEILKRINILSADSMRGAYIYLYNAIWDP